MKNIKAPKIVTIAILTLITAVFWVGFEVYRTFTVKPAPPVPIEIVDPINPTLDQTSLGNIQGRVYLDESQIGQTVVAAPTIAPTIAPTSIPTQAPVASSSATQGVTP